MSQQYPNPGPTPPAPPTEVAGRPWHQKKRWRIALVVTGLVIVAAALGGGGDDGGDRDAEAQEAVASPADDRSDGTEPKAESTTTTIETTTTTSPTTTTEAPDTSPESVTAHYRALGDAELVAFCRAWPGGDDPTAVAGPYGEFRDAVGLPAGPRYSVDDYIAGVDAACDGVVPPEPVVLSGTGDSVVMFDNPFPEQVQWATAVHQGSSNFAVWSLDAGLEQSDLMVNTIGAYQGDVVVGRRGPVAGFEISADGPWSLTVQPLASLPTIDGEASGTGDDVVLHNGDRQVVTITHGGGSNIAVWANDDLLVNDIGAYTGQAILPGGPVLVVITADGPWTITPS